MLPVRRGGGSLRRCEATGARCMLDRTLQVHRVVVDVGTPLRCLRNALRDLRQSLENRFPHAGEFRRSITRRTPGILAHSRDYPRPSRLRPSSRLPRTRLLTLAALAVDAGGKAGQPPVDHGR